MIDVMMDGIRDTVYYQLERIAGGTQNVKLKYVRAQIDLPQEIETSRGATSSLTMDGVSSAHIAQLRTCGNELVTKLWNDAKFLDILGMIKAPRPPFCDLGFDPAAT